MESLNMAVPNAPNPAEPSNQPRKMTTKEKLLAKRRKAAAARAAPEASALEAAAAPTAATSSVEANDWVGTRLVGGDAARQESEQPHAQGVQGSGDVVGPVPGLPSYSVSAADYSAGPSLPVETPAMARGPGEDDASSTHSYSVVGSPPRPAVPLPAARSPPLQQASSDLTDHEWLAKWSPPSNAREPFVVGAVAPDSRVAPSSRITSTTSPRTPLVNGALPAVARDSPWSETHDPPANPSATRQPQRDQNPPAAPVLTAAAARTHISTTVDELFASRNVEHALQSFIQLPARHHSRLVDALVASAVESRSADADADADTRLVAQLFRRAVFEGACAPAAWEAGFALTAGTMCSVVEEEEPRALGRFMVLFKAAGMHRDGERAGRVLMHLADGC